MILKPMVRNNICINAHPLGCAKETERQIDYIHGKRQAYDRLEGPKAVLVMGCSTGYGLASRISAAFGFGAATVGVSFERSPSETSTGTPGWYNNRAFDAAADAAGLVSRSLDGDAFSKDDQGRASSQAAREMGLELRPGRLLARLARARRPRDRGALPLGIKPIGGTYRGRNVDVFTGELSFAEVQAATRGRGRSDRQGDGRRGLGALDRRPRGRASWRPGAATVAYSYIGPELSWPIYRDGTIGAAKAHLEATGQAHRPLRLGGRPLGLRLDQQGPRHQGELGDPRHSPLRVHPLQGDEGAGHPRGLRRPDRPALPRAALPVRAAESVPLDAEGRIRIDELEMGASVQAEVAARIAKVSARRTSPSSPTWRASGSTSSTSTASRSRASTTRRMSRRFGGPGDRSEGAVPRPRLRVEDVLRPQRSRTWAPPRRLLV